MAKPLHAYQLNFGIGLNVEQKLDETKIVPELLKFFNFKSVLFKTIPNLAPFRKTLIQRLVNEDLDAEISSDLEIEYNNFHSFKYTNFISPNELIVQVNLYDESSEVSQEHEFNILNKCNKPRMVIEDTDDIYEFKYELTKPIVKPHHILMVKMCNSNGNYKYHNDYTLIKIN